METDDISRFKKELDGFIGMSKTDAKRNRQEQIFSICSTVTGCWEEEWPTEWPGSYVRPK